MPTFITVPDRQDPEDEGTEGGSKEAPPVVPHRKEGGSDLNAEQDTCEGPGRVPLEAWARPQDSEPDEKGKGGEVKGRAGGWTGRLPPIGAAKQQPTPTAQAAASISVFRDSFWRE